MAVLDLLSAGRWILGARLSRDDIRDCHGNGSGCAHLSRHARTVPMTPERIDLKAPNGDAPMRVDGIQSGDVAGAGVTDGGAVGAMVAIGVKGDRCNWLSELPPVMTWAEFARECSKMERKGFTIKQVPRAEGFDFLKETFYRDHPNLRPTAHSQERTEPTSPPAEPSSSRLRGVTTTEST